MFTDLMVFDIESDGFLDVLTTIHMINMRNLTTGERSRYNDWCNDVPDYKGTIAEGLEVLRKAKLIGGHNIHKFDVPAIKKVYPDWNYEGIAWDSLALSRLIWSDIMSVDFALKRQKRLSPVFFQKRLAGKHSLESWGYRVGLNKGDYADGWDTYSQDMDDYCMLDVDVNCEIFHKIIAKDYAVKAMTIENETMRIIAQQELNGVQFDRVGAEKLCALLMGKRAELHDKCAAAFEPWYRPKRVKGSALFTPKGNNKKMGYSKGVELSKVELVVFNPASGDHIINRMQALFGWEPVDFTDAGKPKVDDATLAGLDYPEVVLIREYLMLNKRLSQLSEGKQNWLDAQVKETGRIHGAVNTNGTVTGRMTHYYPNLAQVPSTKKKWGKECRELFCAREGWKFLGCDASGLELRMLAHYIAKYDGGAYVDVVLHGDIHETNRIASGMRTRDGVKTLFYAYLYGGGDFKLGSIYVEDMTDEKKEAFYAKYPEGDTRKRKVISLGKRTRTKFETGVKGLGELVAAVKKAARANKHLRGLDGRLIPVRSQHSALNCLLQGAGAIVMKQALINFEADLQLNHTEFEDFIFVLNVHDEFQLEVKENCAEAIGLSAVRAIQLVQDQFNFRCPLDGEYQVGRDWSETH